MIISLFRTSHPTSYLLLPLLGVLLRTPLLIADAELAQLEVLSPIELYIVSKPWLNCLVAGVLSGILGIYVNNLSDQFGFLDRVSGLSGLCFVVLSTWVPESASFSLTYLSLGIIIIAFQQLFSLGKTGGLPQVFNASLLITIASLITEELLVLQLLVPFAIVYFQTIHWRHFTIWLIGLATPMLYVFVWKLYYPESNMSVVAGAYNLIEWEVFHLSQPTTWIWRCVFVIALILLAMQSFKKGLTKNTTRIRKSFLLIMWMLIFSIIAILRTDNVFTAPYILLALPLGFMLSNYFFYSKKSVLAEAALIGIVVIELANYWL
jgi:hypothetical protein